MLNLHKGSFHPFPDPPNGKLVDRSYTAYTTRRAISLPRIPPTQLVDRSYPTYTTRRARYLLRIPPTQLVDRSYTAYKQSRLRPLVVFFSLLATRGREGKENGSPVCGLCRLCLNNPPTALVGFSEFSHSLGSVGIVHAQPTNRDAVPPLPLFPEGGVKDLPQPRLSLNYPPTAVGGIRGGRAGLAPRRLSLNYPPTAVGGIRGGRAGLAPRRLSLNYPPTAVGGIRGGCAGLAPRRLSLNYPPTAVGGIRRGRHIHSKLGNQPFTAPDR